MYNWAWTWSVLQLHEHRTQPQATTLSYVSDLETLDILNEEQDKKESA